MNGNIVKVRRKGDRLMAIVLTLGREVIRIICAYDSQSGRPDTEEVRFYDKMASERDLGTFSEIIVSLRNFSGHVGKCAKAFEGLRRDNGIGKRNAEDCWCSVMKKSCA